MESESVTNNTKISDSGYSNSCSNTNSQGSASSKSRHSGSNSSRSSGYGGAPTAGESLESGHQQLSKRNKDREHKRKKMKANAAFAVPSVAISPQEFVPPTETLTINPSTSIQPIGMETMPFPTAVETVQIEKDESNVQESAEPLLTTILSPVPQEMETLPIDSENIEKQSAWIDKVPTEKSFHVEVDQELSSELDVLPQPQSDSGFCCVISMDDGVVLYTTPSLTATLGFPKDMWLGCSFIDFIHPKDRETFSKQITTSVSLPLIDLEGRVKDIKHDLYVGLRHYRGLKPSGSGVVEKVSYQAFHLTVTIKQIEDSLESHSHDYNNGLFLFIIAVPVFSAYKVPGERKKSTKFGMRHTAACIFNHVDPDVVTNFGFMPQDMLGKSVFDFYHPEDIPFLKEVYKSVMKASHINGSVFRSKPYRFLVQNGCFAVIETEWSSVLNPWSRRLEFVISLHQVLQGPMNPDVFDEASDKEFKKIPEEVITTGKVLQAEIIQFLSEELPRPTEIVKEEVSKRYKDLANFMDSLMSGATASKLQIEVPTDFNPTVSERESVMLGEISPHHDFCDSKSSSETPPSYNQLNYNENIHRFFQSNPKTTVTSDESNSASNGNMDRDGRNIQDCSGSANNQKCISPIQNSGASGCGSAGNLSSGSNPNLESGTTSGTNTSNDSYKPPHLTESILVRHNEDMEKIMIRKHREERTHNTKKSHQNLEKYANKGMRDDTNEFAHGIKRCGSRLREGDCHKVSKPNSQHHGDHLMDTSNTPKPTNVQNVHQIHQPVTMPRGQNMFQNGINDVNLWSPFSVTVNPINNTPYATGMLPVYYIPTVVQPRPVSTSMEQQHTQVQYMPAGVLCNYNPIFLPPPIMCPQYHSSSFNINGNQFGNNLASPKENSGAFGSSSPGPSGNGLMPMSDQRQFGSSLSRDEMSTSQVHRPSSQATSVKAEPGSRMGSIASASVVNKALSECSRKDLGLRSVCSPDTPLVSPSDGEMQAELFKTDAKQTTDNSNRAQQPETSYRTTTSSNTGIDEGSSCYSSSYSSFLKTDTSLGSNDDSSSNNKSNLKLKNQLRKTYPLRKKDPPWVESVSVSSDLIYRYQVAVRDLEDILKTDLNTLKGLEQPMMVNEQLHQLYIEMELEGLSKTLTLEEGFSSSSSSGDDNPTNVRDSNNSAQQPKRKKRSYSSLMMIYEEDAPFPPPEANS